MELRFDITKIEAAHPNADWHFSLQEATGELCIVWQWFGASGCPFIDCRVASQYFKAGDEPSVSAISAAITEMLAERGFAGVNQHPRVPAGTIDVWQKPNEKSPSSLRLKFQQKGRKARTITLDWGDLLGVAMIALRRKEVRGLLTRVHLGVIKECIAEYLLRFK